jgi:hypothetical protein
METKQDSSARKGTPWVLIGAFIAVAALDVFLVHLWWLGNAYSTSSLKDLIEVVEKLMIGSAAVLAPVAGIEIPKIFRGTPYYPRAYGKIRLCSILSPYIVKASNEEHYRKVVAKITEWQKPPAEPIASAGQNSIYWETVFLLQKISREFSKVWNDYNYCQKAQKLRLKRYMEDLERYVFLRVYEETEKSIGAKSR